MSYIDYKSMSKEELTTILLKIKTTAENLMNRITKLEASATRYSCRCRNNDITTEFAMLKNQLKEIYHYTQLVRNTTLIGTFYRSFFCPTITDCYVHCSAKSNETNLDRLYKSLFEIRDYICYYVPESKTD